MRCQNLHSLYSECTSAACGEEKSLFGAGTPARNPLAQKRSEDPTWCIIDGARPARSKTFWKQVHYRIILRIILHAALTSCHQIPEFRCENNGLARSLDGHNYLWSTRHLQKYIRNYCTWAARRRASNSHRVGKKCARAELLMQSASSRKIETSLYNTARAIWSVGIRFVFSLES